MGISYKLRRLAFGAAVASAALIGLAANAPGARADVTWVFNDVGLSDGGTLAGSFTLNDFGMLSGWDLTTTAGSSGVGAYTYTPGLFNGMVNLTHDELVLWRMTPMAYDGGLQLAFSGSLFGSGTVDSLIGGVGGPSVECGNWNCTAGPERFALGGEAIDAVSAIPEPATWTMMLLGIGATGFYIRRRSPRLS